MRLRLAEKTLEEDLGSAIDDLNAQIRTNREALNADLPVIDRQAALNEAKDRLARQSLDKSALENANKRIEDFDTNVQLQLKSRELGAENIYNVMQDFQDDLEDHKDNMQVMAKVQILEEYRNLIDKFVESIKRQNEAKEQQTHTAALSAGYIEHGSQYIKKGQGSTNLGFVDAIRHYDIESEADNFKQTSQIFASEEQFNRLMEQSSMPEFQAILHVEKLKVQKWMESISGTAQDPATRARTNDPDKLGEFGMWIGRGPDGHHASLLEHGAGKGSAELYGGAYINLAAQSMSGGLGQMGAAHSRPGMPGTPGFYLQLSFYNQMVAERNAEYVANAGGTIDPVSGLLNSLNPVAILAQTAHNVEVGSRVHGHDRGNLLEANLVDSLKQPLVMAGGVITGIGAGMMAVAGWTGAGALVGGLVAAGGMLLSALGNSIQSNPTTGEYGLRMTNQAAVNTLAGSATSFALGAASGKALVTSGKAANFANASFSEQASQIMAAQAATAPTEFSWRQAALDASLAGVNYDSQGRLTGIGYEAGDEYRIGGSMLGNAATSVLGQKPDSTDYASHFQRSLYNAAAGQGGNIFGEYAAMQRYGLSSDRYRAAITPRFSNLANLFSSAAIERYKAEKVQPYTGKESWMKEVKEADQANQRDHERRTAEFFQGWQFWKDEEEMAGGFGGDANMPGSSGIADSGTGLLDILKSPFVTAYNSVYGSDAKSRGAGFKSPFQVARNGFSELSEFAISHGKREAYKVEFMNKYGMNKRNAEKAAVTAYKIEKLKEEYVQLQAAEEFMKDVNRSTENARFHDLDKNQIAQRKWKVQQEIKELQSQIRGLTSSQKRQMGLDLLPPAPTAQDKAIANEVFQQGVEAIRAVKRPVSKKSNSLPDLTKSRHWRNANPAAENSLHVYDVDWGFFSKFMNRLGGPQETIRDVSFEQLHYRGVFERPDGVRYPGAYRQHPGADYGPRRKYDRDTGADIGPGAFHDGLDLELGVYNLLVPTVAPGRVSFTRDRKADFNRHPQEKITSNEGASIYIIHDAPGGGRARTAYMHNSMHLVDEGDEVSFGQPIAVIGRSGNSHWNPHIHFMVWYSPPGSEDWTRVDPQSFSWSLFADGKNPIIDAN